MSAPLRIPDADKVMCGNCGDWLTLPQLKGHLLSEGRSFGMSGRGGAHEAPVAESVEWYTPPLLFEALGLRFDLDPAAPDVLPEWIPADRHYSFAGQSQPWEGRVWLNPPYGASLPAFVQRMCQHGNGLMLTPARTETRWWQQAAESADAVCFLRDRLHFIRPDGYQARASFGSTLFSWGETCTVAMLRADLGWTRDAWDMKGALIP